jgi:hypothetical protein
MKTVEAYEVFEITRREYMAGEQPGEVYGTGMFVTTEEVATEIIDEMILLISKDESQDHHIDVCFGIKPTIVRICERIYGSLEDFQNRGKKLPMVF